MSRRIVLALVAVLAAVPALAQQGEWFVPGGQQRPQGQQGQQGQPQRPPQQGQPQRPPQQGQPRPPNPLPPGQPPPAPVIGLVDPQAVLGASTALAQVRDEMERRRARLNEQVQREQAAWREEQTRLAQERGTLNADQIRQRERDLQDRITAAQATFRDRQRNNEQVAQQALQQIQEVLEGVITQVAQSRNINLILTRQAAILVNGPFDLTEEVATQLNRQIQRVTIPPEEGAPAPTPAATPPAQPQPPRPAQPQPPRPAQPPRN